MLRLDLCNYSDAYIIVKGTFTFQTENNAAIDGYNINLILKNHVPFIKFKSNIINVLINNAEDLDNVMPMFNFTEYRKYYSKASGTLWNYARYILILKQILNLLNIRQVLQIKQLMMKIQERCSIKTFK